MIIPILSYRTKYAVPIAAQNYAMKALIVDRNKASSSLVC